MDRVSQVNYINELADGFVSNNVGEAQEIIAFAKESLIAEGLPEWWDEADWRLFEREVERLTDPE